MNYKRCNSWIGGSTTTAEARILLRRIIRTCTTPGACALLACSNYVLQQWVKERSIILPRDRRLIWIVYALVLHPEFLRSPFHILTSGRYLPASVKRPVAGEDG